MKHLLLTTIAAVLLVRREQKNKYHGIIKYVITGWTRDYFFSVFGYGYY